MVYLTRSQEAWLVFVNTLVTLLWLALLLPLGYNVYHYVYKQKRYCNFLTVSFYVCAIIEVICRSANSIYYTIQASFHMTNDNSHTSNAFWVFDGLALFFGFSLIFLQSISQLLVVIQL